MSIDDSMTTNPLDDARCQHIIGGMALWQMHQPPATALVGRAGAVVCVGVCDGVRHEGAHTP